MLLLLCRYYEITSEVLTSVKRTEDSLFKLRRNRQSLLPAAGMSDDNKIRLQLALDIEEYNSQVWNVLGGGLEFLAECSFGPFYIQLL